MIANSNTKKIHHNGCRAILMMLEEHKITITDEEKAKEYSPCGWCHNPRIKLLNELKEGS